MPELPTIGETVPGYEVTNWFGIFVPKDTPRTAIVRINADLTKALKASNVNGLLNAQGADAAGGTPVIVAVFEEIVSIFDALMLK